MNKSPIQAALLGVPLDLGAENLGVDIGPNAFRYQGIIEKLNSAGITISDLGDITPKNREELTVGNPKVKYLDEIVTVATHTAEKVTTAIQEKKKMIVLGGDHSVCLGAVSGASVALDRKVGLIYFDAHGDMNTDETTLTGNIHGMHLASLLGFGHPDLVSVGGNFPKIAKENLLHIGGNDLDEAEIQLIEREQLDCYQIRDVLSFGLGPLLEKIAMLSKKIENIWISLDLDAIDEIYAPGAGMPNRGGLSYREVTTLFDVIGKTCNVMGIDVVEYNPLQDKDGKTAELGIELIARAFGSNYSWYTNYLHKNKLIE